MKHKTARKHRPRKHRRHTRKHRGGKKVTQQRFDNAIQQLKTTTQELAECRQALRHCMRSNRPLPCPPCPSRSTRRSSTPAARGIRGVSPPLSELEYEVPRTAYAVPSRDPRAAATIRRRRDTPSVSAQAQTYGPTPRNRTRRGVQMTII